MKNRKKGGWNISKSFSTNPIPPPFLKFDDNIVLTQLYVNLEGIADAEVQRAIMKLSNNKAPGFAKIPAELLKHGQYVVTTELTDMFNKIWKAEVVPAE